MSNIGLWFCLCYEVYLSDLVDVIWYFGSGLLVKVSCWQNWHVGPDRCVLSTEIIKLDEVQYKISSSQRRNFTVIGSFPVKLVAVDQKRQIPQPESKLVINLHMKTSSCHVPCDTFHSSPPSIDPRLYLETTQLTHSAQKETHLSDP